MTQTTLQKLLSDKAVPYPVISEATGAEINSIHKWKRGVNFPHKQHADKLIRLFREKGYRLDYNGIYEQLEVVA